MPWTLTDAQFERAVSEALRLVPDELSRLIDNVAIMVEAEPPTDDPDLLGVYEGIPLTERDFGLPFQLPDRIVIFQGPLERLCESREELLEEIAITVIHELAHHFGIDDERLHELGWG